MYRVPLRRFKQGIHPDNIRCKNRVFISGVFNMKPMLDCLTNTYMSLVEAKEKGGAFNRYFAINRGVLWYRGTAVGKLKQDMSLVLDPEFHYLKEQLEKAS